MFSVVQSQVSPYLGLPLQDRPVDNDLAHRLLRLEQRLASYGQLHAQELGDMRQELDALKRLVALRPLRQDQAQTVQVDATLCTGCGECVPACPQSMFELEEANGRHLAHVIVWTERLSEKWVQGGQQSAAGLLSSGNTRPIQTASESERTQACAECQLGAPPCITVCAAHAIVLP